MAKRENHRQCSVALTEDSPGKVELHVREKPHLPSKASPRSTEVQGSQEKPRKDIVTSKNLIIEGRRDREAQVLACSRLREALISVQQALHRLHDRLDSRGKDDNNLE